MAIYILVFSLSSLLLYFSRSKKKKDNIILIIVALSLPILLAGFRGIDVGTDTAHYLALYNSIKSMGFFVLFVEPSFYIISQIAIIFGSFQGVLVIYQLLTVLFIYKFAKKYDGKIALWLVFLLYYFIFYNASLNIMRQCLAMSYFIYTTTFLKAGKTKKYFIFSIIGILIHSTEILAAIIYFIIFKISFSHSRKRIIHILTFILTLFILLISFNLILNSIESVNLDFIDSKVVAYTQSDSKVNTIYILSSAFMFLIMLLSYHYKVMSKSNIYLLCCVISCEFAFTLLGSYNVVFSRVGLYFTALYLYFIPLFCKSIKAPSGQRTIIQLMTISFFFFYWLWIIGINNSNHTIPYSFA